MRKNKTKVSMMNIWLLSETDFFTYWLFKLPQKTLLLTNDLVLQHKFTLLRSNLVIFFNLSLVYKSQKYGCFVYLLLFPKFLHSMIEVTTNLNGSKLFSSFMVICLESLLLSENENGGKLQVTPKLPHRQEGSQWGNSNSPELSSV